MSSCICARECDCEKPPDKSDLWMISNECPEHNWNPAPDPDCEAAKHWDGR